MKTKILAFAAVIAVAGVFTSCNDYLDKEPLSQVSPELYFDQESQLESYCNNYYTSVLPSHGNWSYGLFGDDNGTDNMAGLSYNDIYVPGKWKTSMSNGNYSFGTINNINYFLGQVLPKYENKEIQGSDANIRHYIGEMLFMRAWRYFNALKTFGDYPIIEECLPDDIDVLAEASKRRPQNEVARFIISDLDKAIDFLKATNKKTTRINLEAAYLLKSRVALYEGTWLKNFAGTAFVPGTAEWPGKAMYPDYKFPAGSFEAEWKWFLTEAMSAAKVVADKATLVQNTGVVPQTEGGSVASLTNENPWLGMFSAVDMSGNKEVLLWRQYNRGLGIVHNVTVYAQVGNAGVGTTRGAVDCFLCKDGLPIYASPLYKGDETITDVRTDRDPRLFVLLKEPGQKNILVNPKSSFNTHGTATEPKPQILESSYTQAYSTGYALRKGNSYDGDQCSNGDNYTGCPIMRSVEALLNYIEADYELNGTISPVSDGYWKKIRARHTGMEQDYTKAINATIMSEEAKGDWGAYTAGVLIDPVRYNIRRERRCELFAETFRWADLKRWRSFDQMVTTPYHIEGIHIWNTPMTKWYKLKTLRETISSIDISEYLRPYEAKADSEVFDGYRWTMAHYWDPMPIYQMVLASPTHESIEGSYIYQNPYWPTEPDMPATK